MTKSATAQLGTLDKLFPVFILATMRVGLLLGRFAPQQGSAYEPLIPLGLFLMIYPTVAKVPFGALRRSALEGRPRVAKVGKTAS